jgi:hypothetical protein
MKQTLLITLLLVGLIKTTVLGQALHGEFPVTNQSSQPILTSDILVDLKWEQLKAFCDTTEGQYARVIKDSLITEYDYTKQGGTSYFRLKDFNGKVLSFESGNSEVSRPTKTEYFDKDVWLEYSHAFLSDLPDSLKMSVGVRKDELISYYKLLGVGTRDEYGWICEYSTVGTTPGRRNAVIRLRLEKDLLVRLLNYPNVQTRMYAADALIFENYANQQSMAQTRDTSLVSFYKSQLLTPSEWEKIYQLRDANLKVRTCGNSGSYKVYESTTSELLSYEVIKEIPKEYERLAELGYLKLGYKK